jgi:hypothetical protein
VAVVVAALAVAVAPTASVAKAPTSTASVKKRCAAKHRGSSKRARAARRRCVAKGLKRKRAPAVAAPAPVVPPTVAPAAPAPAVVAPADPVAAAPVASAVGVEALDPGTFVLRLSRASVPAGTLTVYFRNRDVGEHNLWIAGPGLGAPLQVSDSVGENGTASKKLAVTPGAWRLYCSLPGHEAMSATLSVG